MQEPMTGFTSGADETSRMDETPSTTVPQLPVSNVAFLWPASVYHPEAWRRDREAGVPQPVTFSGDTGDKKNRANAVVAAALIALRDYGLVQFAIERKKILFVKTVEVNVTVTGQAVLGGIEADLLAAAAHEKTVWDTVRRWFRDSKVDPWGYVNATAIEWGVRYAVLRHLVEKHKWTGDMHSYPIVPEVVTACRPQADALAQRWLKLREAESELALELVGKVRGAISSREYIESESGGN